MRKTSLKRNFLYSSAYQVLLVITPLVMTPWLSRTIGAEGNGIFTYTQSIANYFVLVSALGIQNYGVREIAACGEDRALRSRTFWETIAMSASVGVLVLLIYIIYVVLFGGSYTLYWVVWSLWVLGSVADPSWLFFGCQEFRMPTIRSLITRVISVLAILLLVRSPKDTWIYVLAIAGLHLLNSLLLWPFVGQFVDWACPSAKGALSRLKPNAALFIPVLATSLYTLMDKVMLGSMAGVLEVGMYDYAEKISKMPLSIITALGAVTLPKMTEIISAGQIERGKDLVRDTMWFMQACAMALSFGIAAIAPEFVPIFFGDGFNECISLMRVLCIIIPLICATNVMGVQYLLPCRRDRDFTLSVSVGALVNIIVNLFLIPAYGALGAAWATVLSEIAVMVYQVLVIRNEIPLLRCFLDSVPFVIIGVVMFSIIRAIVNLGILPSPSIQILLVEFTVGATSYLVLSYLWCWISRSIRLKRVFPNLARW